MMLKNIISGKMISASEYFERAYDALLKEYSEIDISLAERWIDEDSDFRLVDEEGNILDSDDEFDREYQKYISKVKEVIKE